MRRDLEPAQPLVTDRPRRAAYRARLPDRRGHGRSRARGSLRHARNRTPIRTRPDSPGLLCVHQPSVPFVHEFRARLDVRADIVAPTFHRTGNMGAATVPLSLAAEQGRLRPGDTVALFGLASGGSAGVMPIDWPAPPPAPALRR
ncbi:3-oxoacyl-[acyl-carrier-protein] synthase III C-terminal domain-containing protein [Streptomyces mirabilis]|uniref:3-oxoacyl-[acyl-carrier-protein] synthase III C-terminal domain-containing protein n=1 Tax=Streptomyces mirabilis TaxID=68239 RepID=UPI003650E14D